MSETYEGIQRCMIFKPLEPSRWPDPHRHPLNRRLPDGCEACDKSLVYCHAMSPAECCPACTHVASAANGDAAVQPEPSLSDLV